MSPVDQAGQNPVVGLVQQGQVSAVAEIGIDMFIDLHDRVCIHAVQVKTAGCPEDPQDRIFDLFDSLHASFSMALCLWIEASDPALLCFLGAPFCSALIVRGLPVFFFCEHSVFNLCSGGHKLENSSCLLKTIYIPMVYYTLKDISFQYFFSRIKGI